MCYYYVLFLIFLELINMIFVFNLGGNVSIFITRYKNYPVIWIQRNIQKETGVLRLPIYSKIILKQYNNLVKNLGKIINAFNKGTLLDVNLERGGMVRMANGVMKIESTTLEGTIKSIDLNQLQFNQWIKKSEQIEEILSSYCPGGAHDELVLNNF